MTPSQLVCLLAPNLGKAIAFAQSRDDQHWVSIPQAEAEFLWRWLMTMGEK